MEPLTATYLSLMLLTVGVIAVSLVFNAAGQRLHERVRALENTPSWMASFNSLRDQLNLRISQVEVDHQERLDELEVATFTGDEYGAEGRLNTIDEILESNARDIEALRERVESVEEVCATQKQIDALTRSLDLTDSRFNDVEQNVTLNNALVDGMTKSVAEIRETCNDVEGIQRAVASLIQSDEELRTKVAKLQRAGPDLREKLEDLSESMTLLAHEATVDRDRVCTMSNKLDSISRDLTPPKVLEKGHLMLRLDTSEVRSIIDELKAQIESVNKAFNGGGQTRAKTSRPFIDVVPDNQNLHRLHHHLLVQDSTGTQIPPRIARTANGKLAIRIYTDGAPQ